MIFHELEEIILPNEKFTFLVGAGISMEPPSGLKSAVQIVNTLVKLCATDKEISKILSLQGLRYETVVEFIQKHFDPKLRIMDFFDNYTQPNILHYLLAHSVIKGHHVITTNFDYLIEFALINIIEDKSKILPIITRIDFMNYADPDILAKEGRFPIYKIHGSKKNIITNEDTRDTLVTTISALGRDRDEKTFAIEDYKKPALVNLLEGRTLFVMGYSGNDDFDISPTLKELQNISKIIWVDHTSAEVPEIFRIEAVSENNAGNTDRITSLLRELGQISIHLDHPIKIFKINVNTAIFVRDFLWKLLLNEKRQPNFAKTSLIEFDYENWFQKVLHPIDEIRKLLFTWELYYRLAQPDNALRIGEMGLSLAKELGNVDVESSFLNNNGLIYLDKGDPEKALECYERALDLGALEGSSMTLNNIGMVFKSQRKYQEAIVWLKKALAIAENSPIIIEKITILNNIGLTYFSDRKYQEAFEYYQKALEINKDLGDLGVKSRLLSNIGSVYFSKNEYENALEKFQEALQISEELGDLNGITVRLNNIASIYAQQGKKKLALANYEKALEKVEILGDLAKKAIYLTNMALLHSELNSKDKAVKLLEKALPIDKMLNDMNRVLFDLKKAGNFSKDIGDYQNALRNYEEALDYYEKVDDLGGIAGTYNDIAMVYYNQGRITKAIETLEEAIDLATQGGFGSTPEVQDFNYGLAQLKQKLNSVADLEEIFKNWREFRLPQIQMLLNEIKLEDLVKNVNENPYLLEGYQWEKEKGKPYLEKILELLQMKNEEEPILNAKGFLLAFLKRFEEALIYFEKALAINPGSVNATAGKALCLINKPEFDQALNLLKKFESTGNYLILYLLAFSHLRMKDFQNAEEYARRVLEIKPNFLPVLNILGTIYYYKNDFKKANEYWQESLNLNQKYLKPYSNLGFIYLNQQHYEKAEEIFKSLLELDINDKYTLNMLARIYFNTRQTVKGEWILKRMLLLNPKDKDALQNLAGLYYNAGSYAKSEIYYKKALELDPKDLKNLEYLMNTYRGMGNTERVEEIRELISDLNHDQRN
ncbi:MAG: tetratricopeptide repeat protein [Promethearchaeota archaeon]